MDAKRVVRDFWDQASCGEALYLDDLSREAYLAQARKRYALEPYIERFADFGSAKGKRVLEVGVGLGADHQRFAAAGAELSGIDLTPRAIRMDSATCESVFPSASMAVRWMCVARSQSPRLNQLGRP